MDPFTWIYIAIMLVSAYVNYSAMSKTQGQKPPAISEYSVPTADEGIDIQYLNGECWLEDPNILFYGNLRTSPIKAEGGK